MTSKMWPRVSGWLSSSMFSIISTRARGRGSSDGGEDGRCLGVRPVVQNLHEQVGGHQGFAVAGGEGVQAAEDGGEEPEPGGEIAGCDECGEGGGESVDPAGSGELGSLAVVLAPLTMPVPLPISTVAVCWFSGEASRLAG